MSRWWIALLGACALTSKAPPLDVEYFAPQSPEGEAPIGESIKKLRLGDVQAGSHLRSRIAYRESPIQLGFYEERRWTESPEEYTRRTLERELAQTGALVTSGRAPDLEVEVLAFEEVRAPRLAGRVSLHYRVIDDRKVVRDGIIDVTRPANGGFGSVVVAIGGALEEASSRVVSEALASL